jgi:hypothetical protein
MIYTLYLWTVVAVAGDRHFQNRAIDWRPIGEFASKELCEDGARQLGISIDKSRCVRTK